MAMPVSRHVRRRAVGVHAVLFFLALLAMSVSVALAQMKIASPGFDFRYFWVAGRTWLDGASPYGPAFLAASHRLIDQGHLPEIWPYPPTLFLPTVVIGLFEFHTAWIIWQILRNLAVIAASAVLAFGMPVLALPGMRLRGFGLTRPGFFALHFAIVAGTEATVFSNASGQFSEFVYLALCVALVGLARGKSSSVVVVALAVTFMKPQIGGILAIGLLVSGRQGAALVAQAALLSLILLLPALAVRPTVLVDWLHVLGRYDDVNNANLPVAMTGVRNLLWVFADREIGNLAALVIASGIAACVALWRRRAGGRLKGGEAERLTATVITMTLVALALSPLHLYDFSLFGVAFLALAGASGPRFVAAAVSTAVIMRPTAVQILLSGGAAPIIFAGSTFATVAAMVILFVDLTRRPG